MAWLNEIIGHAGQQADKSAGHGVDEFIVTGNGVIEIDTGTYHIGKHCEAKDDQIQVPGEAELQDAKYQKFDPAVFTAFVEKVVVSGTKKDVRLVFVLRDGSEYKVDGVR